jgi:hypothetical protein
MIGKTEQVTVGEAEEGDRCYAYVSFHSARAASQARAATSAGEVRTLDTHFEDSDPVLCLLVNHVRIWSKVFDIN